jgi:hypothetical protein
MISTTYARGYLQILESVRLTRKNLSRRDLAVFLNCQRATGHPDEQVACDVLSLGKSRSVMQGKRVGRGYAGNGVALSNQQLVGTESSRKLACGSEAENHLSHDKFDSAAPFIHLTPAVFAGTASPQSFAQIPGLRPGPQPRLRNIGTNLGHPGRGLLLRNRYELLKSFRGIYFTRVKIPF